MVGGGGGCSRLPPKCRCRARGSWSTNPRFLEDFVSRRASRLCHFGNISHYWRLSRNRDQYKCSYRGTQKRPLQPRVVRRKIVLTEGVLRGARKSRGGSVCGEHIEALSCDQQPQCRVLAGGGLCSPIRRRKTCLEPSDSFLCHEDEERGCTLWEISRDTGRVLGGLAQTCGLQTVVAAGGGVFAEAGRRVAKPQGGPCSAGAAF
jgi:hypothetical protein